ncbi:SDR family oxidoreductase [Burkholderia reimsis]|uniref:SDR family oxidoreductase n=1 Tax=Burkholderia reimsis TaxID=2234132 RepID=UPI001401D67E
MDAWDRLLQVNLTAPLQLAVGLLGGMKEKKWGRVINISSISVYDNTPFNMLYAATKSALQSFTRAWARQMASSGVTVNAVTPGFTETPFTEALSSHASREAITAFEAYERVFRTYVPTRRSVLPAEIASAVLFLCSKYSGSITGDVINVSGGQFMTA